MKLKDQEVAIHYASIMEAVKWMVDSPGADFHGVATLAVNRDGSVDVGGLPFGIADCEEEEWGDYLVGGEVAEGLAMMIGFQL